MGHTITYLKPQVVPIAHHTLIIWQSALCLAVAQIDVKALCCILSWVLRRMKQEANAARRKTAVVNLKAGFIDCARTRRARAQRMRVCMMPVLMSTLACCSCSIASLCILTLTLALPMLIRAYHHALIAGLCDKKMCMKEVMTAERHLPAGARQSPFHVKQQCQIPAVTSNTCSSYSAEAVTMS